MTTPPAIPFVPPPGVKACCRRAENLAARDTGRADLVLLVCQVCGCRHFEATAAGGRMGATGAAL